MRLAGASTSSARRNFTKHGRVKARRGPCFLPVPRSVQVIELTVLAIVGLGLFLLALFIVAGVIRIALWLFLLPFRLIFGLLLLPILLIKTILGGLWFVLFGPLFAFV